MVSSWQVKGREWSASNTAGDYAFQQAVCDDRRDAMHNAAEAIDTVISHSQTAARVAIRSAVAHQYSK